MSVSLTREVTDGARPAFDPQDPPRAGGWLWGPVLRSQNTPRRLR